MNQFERAGRTEKAVRLAEYIQAQLAKAEIEFSPVTLRVMETLLRIENKWPVLAKAAGVNPPSEVTKALVLDMLRRRCKEPEEVKR